MMGVDKVRVRLKKNEKGRQSVRLVIRWLRDKIADEEWELQRAKRLVENLELWMMEDEALETSTKDHDGGG